ncbi:MAG: DUF3445 domain-containing protein [Devosia sp.]
MATRLHTPYDGSSRLFEIGLKPLDPGQWIEVDEHLSAHLAEKDRLEAVHSQKVFAAEPGTEAAQAEVLALLVEHLPRRFPDIYRRDGETIEIIPAKRHISLTGAEPLRIASHLVQEDLILMRRGEPGWRLAAGALCFPSSWRLRDKFGLPIHEIHRPVPGFGAGTRPAELIARMFDKLRPDMPVLRWNWSLYGDDQLFHPESADPKRPRFGPGAHAESVFLRVERQTLRKLPMSSDILFTIRILVDPVTALEHHSDAARIRAALVAQLEALNSAQLDYKGLTLERDRLIARLSAIGASR